MGVLNVDVNLDPLAIADFIQKVGIVGLLILIVVGGARRVWVYGWYADELRNRAERAEDKLEAALKAGERATSVAEKVVAQ